MTRSRYTRGDAARIARVVNDHPGITTRTLRVLIPISYRRWRYATDYATRHLGVVSRRRVWCSRSDLALAAARVGL